MTKTTRDRELYDLKLNFWTFVVASCLIMIFILWSMSAVNQKLLNKADRICYNETIVTDWQRCAEVWGLNESCYGVYSFKCQLGLITICMNQTKEVERCEVR